MSDWRIVRKARVQQHRYQDIVVSTALAGTAFNSDDDEDFGPWVDHHFLSALRAMSPEHWCQRRTSVRAEYRAIVFAVDTDTALLATAPSGVTTLLTELDDASVESYIYHSEAGGDLWIVGKVSDACRHGGYEFLRRQGVRYFAPHPNWWVFPRRTRCEEEATSSVVAPRLIQYQFEGNGGLQSAPHLPGQDDSVLYWKWWKWQLQAPNEVLRATSDGDSSFTTDRQYELANDRTMLAWVASEGKRGWSASGDFPLPPPVDDTSLGKLCYSHHGTSGVALPAASTNPTPWVGATLTPSNSALPNADPGDDDENDPNLGEYTSYSGGFRLHADHHVEVVLVNIATFGTRHPLVQYVNCEPNDGSDFCDAEKCLDLLREGPYSAYLTAEEQTEDAWPSENLAHRANMIKQVLDRVFAASAHKPGVGWAAYAAHIEPPRFPIEPGTFVAVVTSSSGYHNRWYKAELPQVWADKRDTNELGPFLLGTYNSWAITPGTWDAPLQTPEMSREEATRLCALNYRTLRMQTTHSSMCMGDQFYACSRMAWEDDPATAFDGALAEWYEQFGPAEATVYAMRQRMWRKQSSGTREILGGFVWNNQDIAFAYAAMLDAQSDLDGSGETTDAHELHLYDQKLWVEHLRRYTDYVAAQRAYDADPVTGLTDLLDTIDAVLEWCWRTVSLNVIHSKRIAERTYSHIPTSGAEAIALRAKWNYNTPGSGFTGCVAPTAGELQTLMEDGADERPGLADVDWVEFSDDLVSWDGDGGVAGDVTRVDWIFFDGDQRCRFVKPSGAFTFRMRTQDQIAEADLVGLDGRTIIRSLDGTQLAEFSLPPLSTGTVNQDLDLGSLAAGTYELYDVNTVGMFSLHQPSPRCGDKFVCVGNHIVQRGFSTATHVYFFVPDGLARVAMTFATEQTITFYHGKFGTLVSADAGADTITLSGVTFENDDQLMFRGTSLPGGITSGTRYFVINKSGSTCQISTTQGGSARNLTSSGSGVVYRSRVATNEYDAPYLHHAEVPSGEDDGIWSFTGYESIDNNAFPRFWGCPNVFAASPWGMMIPSELA